MKVQLIARFPKKKVYTQEEKDEIEVQKLINPEYKEEIKIEHEYEDLILDLKDVAEWLRYDANHTQIMKYNNIMYILKIPFEYFTNLYEERMGCQIIKVVIDDEPKDGVVYSEIVKE